MLALLGAAATVAGGIGSAVAAGKARQQLDSLGREYDTMFNKDYYQDYTQRADVQSALARMREQMKRNSEANRNTAAVTGATPEAAIAAQEADRRQLGETTSNIAGQATTYKDQVKNRYMQQKQFLTQQRITDLNNQSAGFASLASMGAKVATGGVNSKLLPKMK